MKKYYCLGLFWLFFCEGLSSENHVDLEYVRQHYAKASTDKNTCEALLTALGQTEASSVHLAYLGAFQTIWAKHVLNPFRKLSTFRLGKKSIEKAVQQSPESVEIRFVRLSIQQNCPAFLGYRQHIEEDKTFIQKQLNTIRSVSLKKMVLELIQN